MAKLSTRLAPRLRPLVLSLSMETTASCLNLPNDEMSLGESRGFVSKVNWLRCRCRLGLCSNVAMRPCYLALGPKLCFGMFGTGALLMVRRTVELVNLGSLEKRQQKEP